MNKILFFLILSSGQYAFAQNFVSSSSKTEFFSSALLEDITAFTTKGKSAINVTTGEIVFSIPIKSFQFERFLMQEHFNEKYLESEKFPKAVFKGKITNWLNKQNSKYAEAIGILTIHGVAQELTATGEVEFEGDKLIITANFYVRLEDYDIEVPTLMFQKIAEVVGVTVRYEFLINDD